MYFYNWRQFRVIGELSYSPENPERPDELLLNLSVLYRRHGIFRHGIFTVLAQVDVITFFEENLVMLLIVVVFHAHGCEGDSICCVDVTWPVLDA